MTPTAHQCDLSDYHVTEQPAEFGTRPTFKYMLPFRFDKSVIALLIIATGGLIREESCITFATS